MRTTLPRSDRGWTLVEILVVASLMSVIGVIVASAVIQTSHANRVGLETAQASAELQTGVERVTRELRAADPLLVSDDGDYGEHLGAVVYRDRGDTTERREYVYRLEHDPDSDQVDLVEDLRVFEDLDAPDDATPDREYTGLFIERIANHTVDGAPPVFRYYDADGDEIVDGDPNDYVTAQRIEVTLVKDMDHRDPIAASSSVTIRSTRFGLD